MLFVSITLVVIHLFPLYVYLGTPTPVKEVSNLQVSSAPDQQVSAPDDTRYEVDNEAEESSDADGWDDAWDDEERWGEMEVR